MRNEPNLGLLRLIDNFVDWLVHTIALWNERAVGVHIRSFHLRHARKHASACNITPSLPRVQIEFYKCSQKTDRRTQNWCYLEIWISSTSALTFMWNIFPILWMFKNTNRSNFWLWQCVVWNCNVVICATVDLYALTSMLLKYTKLQKKKLQVENICISLDLIWACLASRIQDKIRRYWFLINRLKMWQKLKYFGRTVINKTCIHKEIKSRLNSGNACYQSVQKFLSSSLLKT
jgi:hypothetical protein